MSAANVTRWLTPRDWEAECEACSGAGKIDRSEPLHVDGRYMGQDLFREVCDSCDGRGFTVNVEDVPGFTRATRTLPASDTITLDSLETSEAEARTLGALWLDLPKPRFVNVICSNCGSAFGPGDSGFSHCESHKHLRAISWQEERALEQLP